MIKVYILKDWTVISEGEAQQPIIIPTDHKDLLETILDTLIMGVVGRMSAKKRVPNFMLQYDKEYKKIVFKKIKAPINEFLVGVLE